MSDEPRQQIEIRRLPRSRMLADEAPDRFSRTAQTVEVEFNRIVHFAFDAVSRRACGERRQKVTTN